ncbi:phage minor head protein [uncultured Nitratireductor sp.]|uniref:phage minor head protein n=1 Tax=uncultured Nitratireductor sp. TaxID=520953 RepID=UPI00260A160F|nr:phage minor head protein [uncultured Nitratireductor sp.]
MARKIPLYRRIRSLIDDLEPSLQEAFLKSVSDLRNQIVLKQVVEALEARDVDRAIRALNIDRAAFSPLRRAVEQAYGAGGEATIAAMPVLRDKTGARVVVRFDVADPRAEAQIARHAGKLITGIVDDTIVVARNTILDGFSQGAHPHRIGLDLAGRISRATGRREGGAIGMTSPQAEAAQNLRDRLLSGDPAEMRKVLGMGLRDKRFDRTIIKAIEEGKPVAADMVSKMQGRYADNAVKLRGRTIARTETGNAVMAAKHEAFRQGLEKSGYTEQAVTRKWRSAGDGKVRHSHQEMNGQTVRGLSAPFVSPVTGARMMHPLDTSLGAGAEDVVACRCDEEINIDFFEGRGDG